MIAVTAHAHGAGYARLEFTEQAVRAMKTFEDTLTDPEFASALRESPLASLERSVRSEPDLSVDGLGHSFISRLLTLFLPKGSD